MLIVKKPFDRLDEENKIKKMHEEREEKPIAEEKMLISENYHGGEESTESLPNTSNNSSNQSSRENAQSSSQYSSQEEKKVDDSESLGNLTDSNTRQNTQVNMHESNGNEDDETNSESSAEYSSDELDSGNENSDNDDADDEYDEDNEDEPDDESNDQEHTYSYNTDQAFDFEKPETSTRYFQTEFYRFIEMIAEERTKIFDPRAGEEYNVKKLILRPYERRSLNYYRQSRVRDVVILILDNSGSMNWWMGNLCILADLAFSRNDVEVYIAPNGYIEEKFDKVRRIPISHEAVIKNLNGRKVIYVGDFDGANTPIELSWRNDIVWICPESRYRRFKAHSWVRYGEEDFKGAFLRVYDLDEMFHAFKMLLSRQYINKMWIDLHENDKFDDD